MEAQRCHHAAEAAAAPVSESSTKSSSYGFPALAGPSPPKSHSTCYQLQQHCAGVHSSAVGVSAAAAPASTCPSSAAYVQHQASSVYDPCRSSDSTLQQQHTARYSTQQHAARYTQQQPHSQSYSRGGAVAAATECNRSHQQQHHHHHHPTSAQQQQQQVHQHEAGTNAYSHIHNADETQQQQQQQHAGSQQEQQQQRKQHHSTSKPTASMPRPHSDWQIPDRYEIRHLIGTGSYGHVCEAYDKLEKRVVAIKKIHRIFEDLIDCKRILREISILNRLNHDHVVKVLDIVIPKDLERFDELYVVLEIADSDFKKLFRTPVYLTELHIKTLLYNLLVGVKFVHSAGILHRDLKPANCLVNQDCSVKVCDFGLARTVDFPESANSQLPISPREDDINLVTVPHTKNLKRQLTGHVVTRWYRAPELILLQENYTEAIDVWSIGCIFAELLNMIKENVAYHADRGPLFPGSSCFPLSPDQKNGSDYKFHTRGNRDQLNVIFNILGTPSDEDIEALEKDDAKRYIRIFPKRFGIDLLERFPASSADALHLLKRMLVFNPNKRITINECLAHPFFKEVRIADVEVSANEKVRLPFNDWMNMDEPQLRYAFVKEIQRYHPEVQLIRRSQNRTNT